MIKPNSEQVCNTRSCEETRCPSSDPSLSKELYLYQYTYRWSARNGSISESSTFKWNGTIIYSKDIQTSSIVAGGYRYTRDKHITTSYSNPAGDIYVRYYYYCIKRSST